VKDLSALGNLTERLEPHEKGRSAETALAATADEDIYSREGEFKGEYVGEGHLDMLLSKISKTKAFRLLACNFHRLQLACLSWKPKRGPLACLLGCLPSF
jgi:hypothetical protein